MQFADQFNFLKEWLSAPLRIGAVAPSGDSLAEIITRDISAEHAPVIELGPGTGVFTRSLIERGIPENKLALVESSLEFAKRLEGQFPASRILCMDASGLDQIELFEGQQAGAIISGLPLFSMQNRKVVEILQASFAHLRPGGFFFQFTYGPCCPVAPQVLETCDLSANRVGGTLKNVPPAAVYRLSRRNTPNGQDSSSVGKTKMASVGR
ncbi:MAG: methyltransferase domain-containing protein [Bryobacteraceae bacterium]